MSFDFHFPIDDPTQPLRARALRYMLLDELRQRPQMTVADMVTALTNLGFAFAGRPSKVISDALRWEVRRGRVQRIARGVYRYRPTPRSTMRRVIRFADRCRTWLDAHTAGRTPPPIPPDPRACWADPPLPPSRPPWASLSWLWAT